MSSREPGPGRSDVIDAILGKVSDNRTRTETSNTLFRAKALDQLDVATDIDNQLPLVSRRSWLLLLGAGLIVLAFVLWAALTPTTQTAAGTGRVLAPTGLLSVTAPASGFVLEMGVSSGDPVQAGETVAVLQTPSGPVPVTSIVSGSTWQVLGTIGSPIAQGEILSTVLPAGSEQTALVVLAPASAEQVRPGMTVDAGGAAVGTVATVEPPLPASDIVNRTGITVPPGELASIVQVQLNEPGEPGRSANFIIEISSETVLNQIFRR